MTGAVPSAAPEIPVEPRPRSVLARLSPVWAIPIAAILVALGLAWQNWAARGPVIQVAFNAASGIAPGQTELRYRDVPVGVVERVSFSPDLDRVLVTLRLDSDIADYVDADASFFIVQPEVTLRGVTGLDTVLTGVYIEGVWDDTPKGLVVSHEGQSTPPLLRAGEAGIVIQLRAAGPSSLVEGTPIVYKGIEVGQVGAPQLIAGGAAAVADVVIRAPYAGLIRSTTRFWDTSGFTFSLGPQGAELDFTSLATLISGGVAFETVASGGNSAQAGTQFALYPDEQTARASYFTEGAGPSVNLTVLFGDNVAGLTPGSPVTYGGVIVGEVENLAGVVDPATFGDEQVRLLATISIRPGRLGIEGGEAEVLDFLAERVEEGLRAQLQTASILTGGLKVELLPVADAPAATLDRAARPFPRLPATASDISDVTATAEGVFERINALPVEDLLAAAIGFLDSATALVADGDLRRVPGEAVALLEDVRGLVGSEAAQALPGSVEALVAELRGAAGDLRGIVGALREAGAVERMLAAVDAAAAAAAALDARTDGVPGLVDELTGLAADARALPLEDLVARVAGAAGSADALLAAEDTRALPAEMRAALAQLGGVAGEAQGLAAELREAGLVARLRDAVDAATDAAAGVSGGTAGLPELVARLNAVAAKAESLPVDALAAQLGGLIETADGFLAQTSTQEVPAALNGALAELRATLAELRAGGTVENANTALAAAAEAARAVRDAALRLPALVDRMDGLLLAANGTIAAYGESSSLTRGAQSALREVERAAEAVQSLARALERRPNSLLLGR